jgi:hypothetical protein
MDDRRHCFGFEVIAGLALAIPVVLALVYLVRFLTGR